MNSYMYFVEKVCNPLALMYTESCEVHVAGERGYWLTAKENISEDIILHSVS